MTLAVFRYNGCKYPTHIFSFSSVDYLSPPPSTAAPLPPPSLPPARALACYSHIICIMTVHTYTQSSLLRHVGRVSLKIFSYFQGASVAQWVMRWLTDLAVLSSSPARGEVFSTVNAVPFYTAFHYQPPHRPDMTINTVEKDVKSQVIHPSYFH